MAEPNEQQIRNAVAEAIEVVCGGVDIYDVDAFLGTLEGRGVRLTWEPTW